MHWQRYDENDFDFMITCKQNVNRDTPTNTEISGDRNVAQAIYRFFAFGQQRVRVSESEKGMVSLCVDILPAYKHNYEIFIGSISLKFNKSKI